MAKEEKIPWEVERAGLLRSLSLMEREIQQYQALAGQSALYLTALLTQAGGQLRIERALQERIPQPLPYETAQEPDGALVLRLAGVPAPQILVPSLVPASPLRKIGGR